MSAHGVGEIHVKSQGGVPTTDTSAAVVYASGGNLFAKTSAGTVRQITNVHHYEASVNGNASATTIGSSNVWYRLTASSVSADMAHGFTVPDTAGRVSCKYTGTEPVVVHAGTTLTFTPSAANNTYEFSMVINPTFTGEALNTGTPLAGSYIRLRPVNSADPVSTAIHVMLPLSKDDTVYLLARNIGAANGLTLIHANFFGLSVI